ncbi:hypothetical protein BGZ49_000990 [Haplosporangium sp. Z 27]|nr:hypothetical protein BGZ49_000990 [Haplosporangium sp. Z 27]
MFSSIHEKFSRLLQHHGDRHVETTTSISSTIEHEEQEFVSKNWDYEFIFEGAKDIPIGDILSSDPFLEVYIGSSEDENNLSYITGVQWNTLNPKWNARWNVHNVPEGTCLEIRVMDKDKMKVDTPLGKATIILGSELEEQKSYELDILKSADQTKKGTVAVHITRTRTTRKHANLSHPTTTGPARYSRHTSYAAGVLTRENRYEFYAYRIRLYHILEVFGTDPHGYQHWNVNYDASKRIFAETLEGQNIRNAIHSQHSYLYRHGRTTQYGELAVANDLAELLHGERVKKNPDQDLKTVVFTYSIIPKGIYFSETGTAFFQDFMSKHAMHANRATEVCFSGEFRLFKDEAKQGKWTLLIDNNSGTYGPKKEDLPKVKEIFKRNFPDLEVVALDHEDPILKEIREETKKMEEEVAAKQRQRFALFSNLSSSNTDEPGEA